LTKRDKKNITSALTGILMFILMSVCIYLNLGIYFFFGSLIVCALFNGAFGSFLERAGTQKKVARKPTLKSQIKNSSNSDDLLTVDIDQMSGTDFECLMEQFYTDKGYKVKRVGGSGDHEVDLILQDKKGYKIAVQCKRWKKNVGNDIVLRLKAGKQVHGCYDAWIVTTSHFTRAAIEAADSLNIRLINGAQVHDMIGRWRREKLK